MKVLGVIPARFASTRFPGKLLKEIKGKTVIRRTFESASRSSLIDRLVVATDDRRILKEVESFGCEAFLTPGELNSGTERIAYLLKEYGFKDFDFVVNIQGDEPFISGELIDDCIRALSEDPSAAISTAGRIGIKHTELKNPNVVKVLVDKCGYAIYFTRQNIPFIRDKDFCFDVHPALVHLGLYVYRREFLENYDNMEDSILEKMEKLEQLRALENCYRIKVVKTDKDSLGIDTVEDLLLAEKMLESYEF